MQWIFEKFKGNMAIYSICPKCGFMHNSSTLNHKTMESSISNQYKYCPMCGEYLYDERADIEVIWNERSIIDLMEEMEADKDG